MGEKEDGETRTGNKEGKMKTGKKDVKKEDGEMRMGKKMWMGKKWGWRKRR